MKKIQFTLAELQGRFITIETTDGHRIEEFEVQDSRTFTDDRQELEHPILVGEDENGPLQIALNEIAGLDYLDTEDQARLARYNRQTRPDLAGLKAALASVPETVRGTFEDMIQQEEKILAEIERLNTEGVKPYQRKGGRN